MTEFTLEKHIFAPRRIIGWMLFTLSAGFVNAGAVMACKNFVTHITGNVTNLAADASLARNSFLVVTLFVGGAMLGVFIVETLKARPKVAFALPVLISFSMLFAISLAGKAGWFGRFGSEEVSARTFTMLGLLAAAMGIVNASLAIATNNQVRVTHLTGPATDFAGHVVRAALGAGKGSAVELRWALLRFAKFASFFVGAVLAVQISDSLQYDVFAVAAGILIVALSLTGAPDREAAEST